MAIASGAFRCFLRIDHFEINSLFMNDQMSFTISRE